MNLVRTLFRRLMPGRFREAMSRQSAERYGAFVSYGNLDLDRTLALDVFLALEEFRTPPELVEQQRVEGCGECFPGA